MKNFTTLMKESFEIYKQKIKSVLILLAIFLAVIMILAVLLGGGLFVSLLLAKGLDASSEALKMMILSPTILLFILSYSFLILFIGLSFLILAIRPSETKLKEVLQEAWQKLWQYLWITALVGFFTTLSFIFFIIPGLIVGIYLAFSPYVLITEGGKGMDALKRSWALVKGNWWKVFGRVFLLNIIFGAIFMILSSINDLLGTVFQYFLMPFNVIFMYSIYLELKKSKEIQAPTPIQV